jgi:glutamate/tyrosine decarboxylase-like PLP-dependent enzyme
MFDLPPEPRRALLTQAAALLEEAFTPSRTSPLVPSHDAVTPHLAWLDALDLSAPIPPHEALAQAAAALREGAVRATDPRYFGPFHPSPAVLGVIAAALVAAHDPQLATRSHAPWPVAVEARLIRALGARFGWDEAKADGLFTGGGAESNLTALLLALFHAFPAAQKGGLRALDANPVAYASAEAHPTIARAARIAGLGDDAVRAVTVDARGRMKLPALRAAIARDRAAGGRPFLIVATAGTTATGAIDPLPALAEVAAAHACWLHVDAAFGGLLALIPETVATLDGIARADSITFDPHKALPIPLGTGALLVRHPGALARAFEVRAGYMPRDASRDPYAHGIPWSRRFAALGLLLILATVGWDGVASSLRGQRALADRLRDGLRAEGFRVLDDGPLPIVCFVDGRREGGDRAPHLERLARAAIASGAGWLSTVRLPGGGRALRACVDSHRTEPGDVDRLIQALSAARVAGDPADGRAT